MEIFRDEPLSPTARATVRTWNRELACPMFQCAEHVCMAFGFCLLLQFVESQNPGSLTHVFKLKGQPWASLSFVTYSPVQESCTVSADPGLSLLLSVSHTAKSSLARQGRGPPAKQLRRPSVQTVERHVSQTVERPINHKEENSSGAQVCVNIYGAVWATVIWAVDAS